MRLLLIILTFLLSANVFASKNSDIEEFFSKRFSEVMKSYDSRSTVIVDIKEKSDSLALPGTNFLLGDNTIGFMDNIDIESVSVMVFTEMETTPPAFQEFVDKTFEKYNAKPEIKLFKLEAGPQVDKVVAESVEKIADSYASPFVLFALFAIPLAMLFMFFGIKKEFASINSTLNSQLTTLSSSVENQSGGGANVQADYGVQNTGKQSLEIEKSSWEERPFEFFKAILWECYWCHEDHYAAFIWEKMPTAIKTQFFKDSALDENYINFISSLSGVDLGFAQNSYFMNPLNLDHVSNDDLGEFLKKEKALFSLLSPLRLKQIKLDLKDKIEMLKADLLDDDKKKALQKNLKDIEPSKLRSIEVVKVLDFNSTEEEEEALAMDLDYSVMRSLPSLGWISKLAKEQIEEILKGYSAKDLAACLACPDSAKELILKHIPEKKRELVTSYQKNTLASKNHPAYKALLNTVMSELDKKFNLPENVESISKNKKTPQKSRGKKSA